MSKLAITIDGKQFEVEIEHVPGDAAEFTVKLDGREVPVVIPPISDTKRMHWIIVNNRPYEIVLGDDLSWIKAWSGRHEMAVRDMEAVVSRPASGDGRIKAPIPGLITNILVKVGQEVRAGEPILVLEAMKMENEIPAPLSGFVTDLRVKQGQIVGMGDLLAEIS